MQQPDEGMAPWALPPVVTTLGPERELEAEGLLLRPWQEADAPAVFRAYQDPGIQQWHARCLSPEQARGLVLSWAARWASGSAAAWAVTETGRLVGRAAVGDLDLHEGTGAVAYWVVPSARGRGVAPRALRAVTAWAFDVGLHRLELEHSTQNPASCRVAEKTGYALEGTKRSAALHPDGWHDMHLHARVADR